MTSLLSNIDMVDLTIDAVDNTIYVLITSEFENKNIFHYINLALLSNSDGVRVENEHQNDKNWSQRFQPPIL